MKLGHLKNNLDLPDDFEVTIGQNTEGFYIDLTSPRKFLDDGVVGRRLFIR